MESINTLHKEFNKYANIPAKDKPLLVSGILLALQDETFKSSYEDYSNEELADKLFEAIQQDELESVYNFITARDEFRNDNDKLQENPLKYFIRYIDEHIKPAIEQNSNIDVLGKFYAGLDGKGLGIVLTPTHICELMAELAGVNKDSIVLDTTTGTTSLLIAAMNQMIKDAEGDAEKIEEIKNNQLIGIELQAHMYALALSNMITKGCEPSNLHLGSCFDITEQIKESTITPTVGIINPPYNLTAGLTELEFIENLLNTLDIGGKAVAIVPMSVAIDCKKTKLKLRERLLENHTLDAVVSMPDELFYPTSTNTCIMLFTANVPHNSKKKTWFGYWKDDGLVKTKTEGRIDKNNRYQEIHDQWINDYINQEERPGQCVKACVTASDEWCAEAYLETDYNNLSINDLERAMKNYAIFKLMEEGETVENC